ncbi:ABC transporter permease [Aquimarina sp. MMG015]|uniref:ABC transporter permease n=1 Tax=unclassified Aquimarina TaxID=2627091 RepID=UPI000E4DE5C5|nr:MULTISPECIES: ABC transporter permease [unclassified Aquimarina]AXT54506.1 ABC transporter permease [Aquimarina sp. AD1]MBQ4804643.1 ABC transporter permease [Aquimarina sp. MMG015]RKN25057.1 FtsX-like permease family protein [Aquimarina sp. AD1]
MITNYIKIAFRSLLKNKGYSFLNIFGLAIGITCASLIFLWVEDELSFNESFADQDQIYYIPTNQNYDGEWRTFYSTPGPLAQAMKDEVPGVIKATRSSSEERLFTVGDNAINRQGRYADVDFLEIFSLKFIEGTRENAFNNPEAIVLTLETTEQLFGKNAKALGKTIKVNNRDNYVITGVIENLPTNVTFPFDWVAPFERYQDGAEWMNEYGSNFSDTFVKLSPEANIAEVDNKIREIIPSKNPNTDTYAFLHALKHWHLESKFEGGEKVGGRIKYVRLFSIIALIIMLIACINFMNLSTARSEKRANEVGVRKAIGSSRPKLMIQFVIEALMMSLLASILSIFLLLLILPQFNILIEKDLVLGLSNPLHIAILFITTIISGLFAGIYPAFYLSSFKPVEVLKGIKATSGSASFIRKGLVVGQFTISIVFIICTILVYQQIQHVKNRDLGYNKDQLIRMRANGNIIEKFTVIEQDLKNTGVVSGVALSNSQILSAGNNGSGLQWQGGTDTEDVLISYRHVNSDFFNTTGIELIEGRGFKKNQSLDSTNIIITQSLAKLMGENSPIGKTITAGDDVLQIIGVTKDYQYGDMYASSDPVIFFNNHNYARYFYIKTKSGVAMEDTLASIEKIMKNNNPAFPFEYTFVDEAFDAIFKSEQLVGKLSQIFALLAILISCLGLFGLAAYTAEQRSKEIGVRKVLGASVTGIVKLLSKDFLKLVCIAIVLATPLAWLVMSNWLQEYAYRIEINWVVFIIAGFVAIIIALATVSFQAFKAAIANPVSSLKTE